MNAIAGVTTLEIKALLSDIQSHIDSRIAGNLSSLQTFLKDDPTLRDEIIRIVTDRAGGMCVIFNPPNR